MLIKNKSHPSYLHGFSSKFYLIKTVTPLHTSTLTFFFLTFFVLSLLRLFLVT
jgi:hypothetical protein